MGSFTWLDHILNVCRSVSDVLHILVYLMFVIIAIIIAIYRYDKTIVQKHIYTPFIYFLLRRNLVKAVKVKHKHRAKLLGQQTYRIIWAPKSNRMLYIIKIIKSFFDRKK